MKDKLIHIDTSTCSNWGRRLNKHLFYTQYAPKKGHQYCLNCGWTKAEARADTPGSIERRIIDFHSPDLKNPIFLTEEDIKNKNYKTYI